MGSKVLRAFLCAAAVALTLPGAALAADACPTIEVAAVAPNHATLRVVAGPDGKPVSLAPSLIGLSDITSAAASNTDGADGVGFNLRGAAAARLRAYTASHIGGQLAYVIDGKARVINIHAPLPGDAFWLSPMDAGDARILASRVNNCVTP
jgi:preprotein translocase subunit SecD